MNNLGFSNIKKQESCENFFEQQHQCFFIAIGSRAITNFKILKKNFDFSNLSKKPIWRNPIDKKEINNIS